MKEKRTPSWVSFLVLQKARNKKSTSLVFLKMFHVKHLFFVKNKKKRADKFLCQLSFDLKYRIKALP